MLKALRNHHPKWIFFERADIWATATAENSQSMNHEHFLTFDGILLFHGWRFAVEQQHTNLLLDEIFFKLHFPKNWLQRCQTSGILPGSWGTRFGRRRSCRWRRRVHWKCQREIKQTQLCVVKIFSHKTLDNFFSQVLHRNHPETSAVRKKKILSALRDKK